MKCKRRVALDDAALSQREYCGRSGKPLFAPRDGVCYRCGEYIYGASGYDAEYAASHHLTCCPYCHVSFLD